MNLPINTVRRWAQEQSIAVTRQEMLRRNWRRWENSLPPLPWRIAQPNQSRVTVVCVWCGKLQRREKTQTSDMKTSLTCCSQAHSLAFRAFMSANKAGTPRPLIIDRLSIVCQGRLTEKELQRAAEECRATKSELEEAMRRNHWEVAKP